MNVTVDQLRARFAIEGDISNGQAPTVFAAEADGKQVKCPACNSTVDYSVSTRCECPECGLSFPVEEIKVDVNYQCPSCGIISDSEVVASTAMDGHLCINCGDAVGPYVKPKRTPKRKKHKKQSLGEAIDKDKQSRKFTMTDDGKDAHLHFGQMAGQKLSDMVQNKRSRGYMKWMLSETFPDYLKDAIRFQLKQFDIGRSGTNV